MHLISGEVDEGLLAEVFSNEGIGTLIYANEYQAIRPAQRRDNRHIQSLIRQSINGDQLLRRTYRASIEKQLGEFHVFEIDNQIVGVVAVVLYPDAQKAELSCLQISPGHEHRGAGRRLAAFAENLAREKGLHSIFCLSTQAFTYFEHKLGYRTRRCRGPAAGPPREIPAKRAQLTDHDQDAAAGQPRDHRGAGPVRSGVLGQHQDQRARWRRSDGGAAVPPHETARGVGESPGLGNETPFPQLGPGAGACGSGHGPACPAGVTSPSAGRAEW